MWRLHFHEAQRAQMAAEAAEAAQADAAADSDSDSDSDIEDAALNRILSPAAAGDALFDYLVTQKISNSRLDAKSVCIIAHLAAVAGP